MEIRYDRRRSKTKKNGVGIKSGTIFGSIFPDFGGSILAISVAQFTPTQLALTERRIHKKHKNSYEEIEKILSQKSSEGWDVVSMDIDLSEDLRGKFMFLLQKNI